MQVRVLGSAAGGGVPQWNCGCENCREARRGTGAVRPRTQETVAVSADGASWFLLNVSPEIRAQIESFPPLTPREPRHSPIAGLILTNGDLDHCLGLLSLRESHPLTVYATESVRDGFTGGNVLYRTLERFDGQVTWRALAVGEDAREQQLGDSGLTVTAIATPGKLPLHLETTCTPSPGDNIGLVIRDLRTGGRLAYFSGVAGPAPAIVRALADADVLFFDGTFWSSDELVRLGLGTRARRGHGAPAHRRPARQPRRLRRRRRAAQDLMHINNTNPILVEARPSGAPWRPRAGRSPTTAWRSTL